VKLAQLESLGVQLGSRQDFDLEQAAIIARNARLYIEYLDHRLPRKEDDANRLVQGCMAGLSSHSIMVAVIARAVLFETLTKPLRMLINSLVTRPSVCKLWDAAKDALTKLSDFETLAAFRSTLLLSDPQLKPPFDEWLEKTKEDRDRVLALCTDEYKGGVQMYLNGAAPRIGKLITKHKDRDCEHIAAMRNAPVTTDAQESYFGKWDQMDNVLRSATPMTVAAVAASQASELLKKKDGSQGFYYTILDNEVERETILRFCMSPAGQRAMAAEQKEMIQAQEEQSLQRKLAEERKANKRAQEDLEQYLKWGDKELASTKARLDALIAAAGGGGQRKVLKDQIRIAKYAYQRTLLPAMTKGGTDRPIRELYDDVLEMIVSLSNTAMPPSPFAQAVRVFNARDVNRARLALDRARMIVAKEATNSFFAQRLLDATIHVSPGDPLPPAAVDGEARVVADVGAASASAAPAPKRAFKVLEPFLSRNIDEPLCIVYDIHHTTDEDVAKMRADPTQFSSDTAWVCNFKDVEAWAEKATAALPRSQQLRRREGGAQGAQAVSLRLSGRS